MKKILIGCGVLVLLLGGFVGFILYQLWEPMVALGETWEQSIFALQELEERHPYDSETVTEFDAARFQVALDMRSDMRNPLRELHEAMIAIDKATVSSKLEAMTRGLDAVRVTFEIVVDELSAERMAPSELSHHMMCYWAAASSASAGGGDPAALAPLIEEYHTFRKLYAEVRDQGQNDLVPLEGRLSEVSEPFVTGAREWLETSGVFEPVDKEDLIAELVLLQLSDPSNGLTFVELTDEGALEDS